MSLGETQVMQFVKEELLLLEVNHVAVGVSGDWDKRESKRRD